MSLDKWAYRNTIIKSAHPPNSLSFANGVPFWICHDAQKYGGN
jgi:hypothetical protein